MAVLDLLVILTILDVSPGASQAFGVVATEPKLVSQPELKFPNAAYMGRVAGSVWLKIFIGVDGIPIKTDIARRDPQMAYLFDNDARKWGMGCRFSPALDSSGKPVPAWVVIPLAFKFDHFSPPECLSQADPTYPPEALELGLEGWVGLAVLVKSNGEVDMSQIIVVARQPENNSIFENAAKEAAYHSRYRAAAFEATTVEGWCFIKVQFTLDRSDQGNLPGSQ